MNDPDRQDPNPPGRLTVLTSESQSRTSSSAIVSLGLLVAGLLGTVQALLLVFIVGEGEATDAFLAAYSLYTAVALVGVSMRQSLVPLLGSVGADQGFRARASELLSRVSVLGLALTGALLLLAPGISQIMFRGFSAEGERVALLALLLLAPAAGLQIQAGSISAALNAIRRFPLSVALYTGASLLAVACSAGFLFLFGVLGAGIGLLMGGIALTVGHVLYVRRLGIGVRPHPRLLLKRDQARLGGYLLAGAAFAATQPLSLPIALSAISSQEPVPGTITSYAYAFFIVGLVLRVSSTSLALVTLPDLVEDVARRGWEAARGHLLTVTPFVFAVMVPLLAIFASFGDTLLELVFGRALSSQSIEQLHDFGVVLELRAIPASLYTLAGSLVFALGRSRILVPVAGASLLVYAGTAFALAPLGPLAVAAGHAGGTAVAALLLMGAVSGRGLLNTLAGIARGVAPAFLFAATFPLARALVGSNPTIPLELGALVLASIGYAGLVLTFWRSVRAPFLRLAGAPRARLAGENRGEA